MSLSFDFYSRIRYFWTLLYYKQVNIYFIFPAGGFLIDFFLNE